MKARIRRLVINAVAFINIMQEGSTWRCYEGVPKDAEVVGATQDPQTSNFIIFIAHKDFALIDVQEEVAPLLTLEIRKVL